MALTADEQALLTELVDVVKMLSHRMVQLYAMQRGWNNPETVSLVDHLGTHNIALDADLATVVAET